MGVFLPSTKYVNVTRTVTGTITVEDSDVVLNCDTTLAPVIINLKQIPANYWSTLNKLYVKDSGSNSSVNNITIAAPTGFKINNQQSITINVNAGVALIRISSNTDYVAELNYGIVGNNAITVKNTVYVMKNGSDSTGVVERFDKPFLTIGAAVVAANTFFTTRTNENRVKVVVESGNYDGEIILQNFIDLDLGNSVLSNVNGANFSNIITDGGATFTKASASDVNVFITGTATLYTSPTRTGYQYPLTFNGNGTFVVTLNSILSNNGECLLLAGNASKKVKLFANYLYTHNLANDPLLQPVHILMNTAIDYQGLYEFVGCKIEARDTTNLKSTILASFPALSVAATKYCDLSFLNCVIVGNSSASPAIGTLGANSNEVSGNMNLTLKNTLVYNKYAVDSISALGTGSIINLYNYGSFSNQAVNVNVTNKISALTVNANVLPI